jgi:hypothetical protein
MSNNHVNIMVRLQDFRQGNMQQDIEWTAAAVGLANHVFPLD